MLGEPTRAGTTVQSIVVDGYSWVSVEHPTAAEVDVLAREFRVHRSDLELALDRSSPDGVWRREGYVLIVFRVPVLGVGRHKGAFVASPVALVAGQTFLITIHTGEIRPLLRLFRQVETDERAREAAFAVGVAGLAFLVVQRLIDAVGAARGRVEQTIGVVEEAALPASTAGLRDAETIRTIAHARSEARQLRRLATNLPTILRAVRELEPIAGAPEDGWDRLIGRAERLIAALEDDVAELEGSLLASMATASFEAIRYARTLAVIAALTLPVVTVAGLISLPLGNPLASAPHGYLIGLGVLGGVFLVALFLVRRRGLI